MSTYVYAIAHATHPVGEQSALTGIGDPPAPVRVLVEGSLAAVVSDSPEEPRPKRRDLLAHQHVLSVAGEGGQVLPMRFGSVSPDDETVRSVLVERGAHFEERLRALESKTEFNVKAVHREEPLLRRIVSGDDAIRELNERTRRTGDHQDRMLLGQLVTKAVQEQESADAELVRSTLSPFASDDTPGPERRDCLCNHSFLVDRAAVEDFLAAAERLRNDCEHLELSVHGPLPPYSFVEPTASERVGAGR